MDWNVQTTSVVILGAGFSVAATDGKLPSMRTFFDRLEFVDFPKLHDFVAEVAGSGEIANVESVLLTLDQIRTSPDGVLKGWADIWKRDTASIYQELSNYTLSRFGDCLEVNEDNWAANLIACFGLNTTVISMNYDNIAERILSNRDGMLHDQINPICPHCKMRMLLEKACSCFGREEIVDADWRGALIKPHGSIAWRRCLNRHCCSFECLVADEHCRPFQPCACPDCGKDCGPVLVMPAMSKNLNDTPEIGAMWQAARQAIADAKSILLFGFSMPSSDELLMLMMRDSIHSNRKLRSVASIDLDPKAVLNRFEYCIPNDLTVETSKFAVVPGQIPEWSQEHV